MKEVWKTGQERKAEGEGVNLKEENLRLEYDSKYQRLNKDCCKPGGNNSFFLSVMVRTRSNGLKLPQGFG